MRLNTENLRGERCGSNWVETQGGHLLARLCLLLPAL